MTTQHPRKGMNFNKATLPPFSHKIVLQNSEASTNTNSFFGTGRHKKKKANRLVTLSFSRNPSKSQFFFWEASGWMNRNLLASLLFPPPSLFGRSGNPISWVSQESLLLGGGSLTLGSFLPRPTTILFPPHPTRAGGENWPRYFGELGEVLRQSERCKNTFATYRFKRRI